MSPFAVFPAGWEIKEIKDAGISVIDGDRGKQYPNKSEFSSSGFCLFLNTGNIKRDSFDFSNCDFITEQKSSLLKKGKLSRNDIVLTTRGTVGSVAYYDDSISFEEIRINSGMVIIRPKDDVEPCYLYHLLKSPVLKTQYSLYASGSAQPQLPIKDLRRIKLPIPPNEVQRKIAAILTAYDDLIEVNKRRIALLEKMAEELYREWFVRMRFPGHQDTHFVKGVPEGWEISRVDSLGKIVTGKTPSTVVSRYYGDKYPFIKTPDMHGNMFISETEEKLSEDGLLSQRSQTIPQNSLCVSCIGTGGVVSITTTTSQTNQQINTVCLFREEDLEWGYYVICGLKESIWLFGSTGTTMTNLSKGKFSGLKFLLPTIELRNKFHEIVKPIFLEINQLFSMNRNLTKTRDLLLPRLISGKLSVENLDIQFPPSMQEGASAVAIETEADG